MRQVAKDREQMKKEMRMELSVHMGGLREQLLGLRDREGLPHSDDARAAKGKQKVEVSSDEESYGSYESDVDALSNRTEQLIISEKRKRGEDLPIGDTPPLQTLARKTAKRRLHLSVRHPPMKRSPVGRTPRRCATTKKKIPAPPGSSGKLKFVTDNLLALGKLNIEELKRLCAQEGVQLGTECRKMPILLALADKRSQVAYGDEGRQVEHVEQVEEEANFRGTAPTISEDDVTRCMTAPADCSTRFIDVNKIKELKVRLDGLLLTPLDRNPEETLVLCPKIYFDALMELFVCSPGYIVERATKEEVKDRMRVEAKEKGILTFARWEKKGSFGEAYVMPKHKDLTRFRPICPMFMEPTVRTCKTVVKALNHMLFTLPSSWHFNLRSVSDLVPRLEGLNKKIGKRIDGSMPPISMPYDIKDMFSKLPHIDIIEAVEWIFDYHNSKGRDFIRVNTRGKGSSFGRTTGDDHWRQLSLHDVKAFSDVFGLRLMDDISLIVVQRRRRLLSTEEIRDAFENCYPRNLQLKRTDDGRGEWDFLGTRMVADAIQPYVGCYQMTKNERSIWEGDLLEFKNLQSYRSWGSKVQKSVVLSSQLHRIDRNTNRRWMIPMGVLDLMRESRMKDFPPLFFERVVWHFAVGRDKIWTTTVEWLFK
ncbi:hypothetical protein CBR_g12048 [Chara braunii]|uniref:Uncharacterized protein n=1 Tax=Chara braunii TaxID=69332 RepID=A0A388KRB2_CHABU|nr:hypothetical protein CBR_g12048 [Chara braunii]|eukprot:GBG72473.1 hypothetical protein CBR_g12048 [Chara braunii]